MVSYVKKAFFVDVLFNTEINLCLKRQFKQFVKNAIGILFYVLSLYVYIFAYVLLTIFSQDS